MKVLVAGGAGFVGSHVCDALVWRGHDVVAVDDLSTGSEANVARLRDRPEFRLVIADVAETPDLDVDLVLHLASPASPDDFAVRPLATLAANSAGTWRLLDVARATGARLVFASTSEVYGDPLVHPQPETYRGNVDPAGPRSSYDEGKRFGEALIAAYRREHGLNASVVRLFNAYGPRTRVDDGRVIPAFVAAALDGRPVGVHGDGTQTRSFAWIDDIVVGFLTVALDATADGETFNVGSDDEVEVGDLAARIVRLTRSSSPIVRVAARPDDPRRRRPDLRKVEARYGWRPTTSLDVGLAATIGWYRDQRRGSSRPS